MAYKYLLAGAMAAALLTGCQAANDAKDAAGDMAKDAAEVIAPDLSVLTSGDYVMDKTHGYVMFTYLHQGYSKPILRFNDVDAVLTYDAEDVSNSTVTVDIDPASIDSGVAKFDEHLVGEDMFDVATFPEIKFTTTSFKRVTPSTGKLVGDLTMKGVTKPVTLDVDFNAAGINRWSKQPMMGFSARADILRSDWNLGYAVPAVSDEVEIILEVEFSLKAE